jgi:poly(3-hydroxybutyrate) depolymerase
VVYDKDGATGIEYGLPGETAKVVRYTIEGHGHHWPGGNSALPVRLAGKNTAKLNATDAIWEFFKGHSIVDKTDAQQFKPTQNKPRG